VKVRNILCTCLQCVCIKSVVCYTDLIDSVVLCKGQTHYKIRLLCNKYIIHLHIDDDKDHVLIHHKNTKYGLSTKDPCDVDLLCETGYRKICSYTSLDKHRRTRKYLKRFNVLFVQAKDMMRYCDEDGSQELMFAIIPADIPIHRFVTNRLFDQNLYRCIAQFLDCTQKLTK
jgi:hypothetical protein